MKLVSVAKINPEVMLKQSMLLDGESSTPRRKVIDVNLLSSPTHSWQARYISPSTSISFTNLDISNCNRLFWVRNDSAEASRLWEIGKQIGFNSLEPDESIIELIEYS